MADRIRFYFDEHIPAVVASGLQRRGVDVLTTQEAGRTGLLDPEQLSFANAESRVVVTFDADLLALASAASEHSGIAYCSASKYTVGELIYALLLLYNVLEPADMRNHVEFL